MKLIKLKCSNCGANLEVNEELKNIFCNYCGQNFLLDEEIIKVEHVLDNSKSDIDNAMTYLYNFKEYDKAYNLFLELSNTTANNPLVWEGLLRAYTCNFNNSFENISIDKVKDFYNKFMSLEENKNKKSTIKKIFKDYIIAYNKYLVECEKSKRFEKNMWCLGIILFSLVLCSSTFVIKNQENKNFEKNIPAFDYTLESSKTVINVNEKLEISPVFSKTISDDYDINWYIMESFSGEGGIVTENGVFSSNQNGEYHVCSEINKLSRCQVIKVEKPCQESYIFKLDGASSALYKVEDKGTICPGKYKVKVTYVDDNNYYYSFVKVYRGSFLDYDYLSFYDDWEKIVVKSGDSIEVDSGITKIQLKKIK